MTTHQKELIQYSTATLTLLSGLVLAYISYFISLEIPDSVLWYVSQCMIYAASVFGVAIYINSRLKEISNKK